MLDTFIVVCRGCGQKYRIRKGRADWPDCRTCGSDEFTLPSAASMVDDATPGERADRDPEQFKNTIDRWITDPEKR